MGIATHLRNAEGFKELVPLVAIGDNPILYYDAFTSLRKDFAI